MTKKMLIDASHPEETRVVIVDSNRVEELDFESANKRQLRGNVYLARVTRVEPSLQAAFVEYGGNRHGFLAFSEIHPDYYQIPFEDRMALIEAEQAESEEENNEEDDEIETSKPSSSRRRSASSKTNKTSKSADSEDDDEPSDDEIEDTDDDAGEDETAAESDRDENVDPDEDDVSDAADAEVADEQAKVASTRRKRISRRRYKIQEVVKRGQILLIQAVKEERGNKGAALTTYLSLAGRYCVLMPNTPRGGGISRKIANGSDRKRLKTIMNDLEVPKGMGVIVRTAGAKRTKVEIKRDYDYLARLWEEIRDTTLSSTAPALIHEEGNLVKRSIRDLYNKDIEEVLVQGDTAYKNAKAFIKMLMPSHAKFVKQYKEDIPLFLRYNVERQIEDSLDSVVQLKSGGYLVIHPTEALVSVDVNSGRSTKERNVERTALRTNMEAAEELARQMRLRDLAGLIVVDFIDMDESRNNRAVEKKMKDSISRDRARIQASRISQFGLMEISRQRRRRSLLEGSTAHCDHCSGVGRKRTIESSALAAIRAVEEYGVRGKARRIRLKTSPDVALYLFNEKRDLLQHVDKIADVFTEVVGDDTLIRPSFEIEIIEARSDKREDPLVEIEREFKRERLQEQNRPKRQPREEDTDDEDGETHEKSEARSDNRPEQTRDETDDSEGKSRRKGRRGRRGGRGRKNRDENRTENTGENTGEHSGEQSSDNASDKKPPQHASKPDESITEQNASSEVSTAKDDEKKPSKSRRGRSRKAPSRNAAVQSATNQADNAPEKPAQQVSEPISSGSNSDNTTRSDTKAKPTKRSSARRKAPSRKPSSDAHAPKTETAAASKAATKTATKTAPKKAADDETETPRSSTARRKAPSREPAKKAAPKRKAPSRTSAADSDEAITEGAKPKATSARRKAPAKKAASNETAEKAAVSKDVKAKKAPVKRKAPARKPAPNKAGTKAPKKAAAKKAPVKTPTKAAEKISEKTSGKTSAKAGNTEPAAPKTSEPKVSAPKPATRRAPPRATKPLAASKPVTTSKPDTAIPQAAHPQIAAPVANKAEAPKTETPKTEAPKTEGVKSDESKTEKPKKKGLWNRLLKS